MAKGKVTRQAPAKDSKSSNAQPHAAGDFRRVGSKAARGDRGRDSAQRTVAAGDRRVAIALETWFATSAREFPWRNKPGGDRNAYECLVLEAMSQQTQISRVVERLPRFLGQFPTVRKLAAADEDEVLAAWSGMGYYRRARLLHGAAKAVIADFGGVLPRNAESLRSLPGVGRYTAGAIASMAYGEHAPIVDGNVARVLLRVHGRAVAADDRATQPWLWERAGELVRASGRPGVFNEALMELGATVCLPAPAAPRCGECPLRDGCMAHRTGKQHEIPFPKKVATRRALHCGVAVVRRADGAVLMEQRGDAGMWAGMWQGPTIERQGGSVAAEELATAIGLQSESLVLRGSFVHQTTHREVKITVWDAQVGMRKRVRRGEWRSLEDVRDGLVAVSNAQRRLLLGERRTPDG